MKQRPLLSLKTASCLASLTLVMIFSTGCETDAQNSALLGAAVGALAGQAIGRDTTGTLIGAGVGAGAGYAVGNESDKQKQRQGGNYDY